MPFEIVTTNCERGIIKGTKGFCPVAITEGTPKATINKLFKLAKRQAEKVDDHRKNTRHFFAHFPLKLEDRKYHLLTRGTRSKAGKNGKTGNLVIHQLLLGANELANEGPAAMLANEKHWFTQWSASPQSLKPRAFESFPLSPRICNLWKEATGDSGWAGTPIEAWQNEESCAIITIPSVKSRTVIQMLAETQSLMPVEKRWKIPISIGAWHPFGIDSKFWSAFDKGTQAEIDVMQHSKTTRIDLSGALDRASGKFSNSARLGAWVQLDSQAKTSAGESGLNLPGTDELSLQSPNIINSTTSLPRANEPVVASQPQGMTSKQFASKVSAKTKTWLPGSTLSWLKTITLAVLAAAIPFAFWYGFKLSQGTVDGQMENPLMVATRTEEPKIEPTPPPKPEVKPVDPVPEPVKSPLARISASELRGALSSAGKDLVLDLRKKNLEKIFLFSIAKPNVDFDDQLIVALESIDQRAILEEVAGEVTDPWQKWQLRLGGKQAPVASVLFERANGKFFWQWEDVDLAVEVVERVCSGRLVFAVEDVTRVLADVHASRPSPFKAVSVIQLAMSPSLLKPQLASLLATKENFRIQDWTITAARMLRGGEKSSEQIENTDYQVDIEGKNIAFVLDDTIVKNEVNEWVGGKIADSISDQLVVDELVASHGPYGFRMQTKLEPSPTSEAGIVLSAPTRVWINGIDSEDTWIQLLSKRDELTDKEFETKLKQKLAVDMCEYLGIRDPATVKAIYNGRKKRSRSRDIRDKIRLAIAGVVYKRIANSLNNPIELEISREFRGYQGGYSVVALTWKPELLAPQAAADDAAQVKEQAETVATESSQ